MTPAARLLLFAIGFGWLVFLGWAILQARKEKTPFAEILFDPAAWLFTGAAVVCIATACES